MSESPYRETNAPAEHPRKGPRVRLVHPHLIAAHTVFLTPSAGALLAALNHHRLRDDVAFWRTLLLFGAPGVLLVVLQESSGGPTNAAVRLLLFLAARVAMGWILFREHRPIVQKHLKAGGLKARWYLVMPAVVFLYLLAIAIWQFLTPANR